MAQRNDAVPPGWADARDTMQTKANITDANALTRFMADNGFQPSDVKNADVLDAANEMCAASGGYGHGDGLTYTSAGAKAPNGEGDEYEQKTKNILAFEPENHADEVAPVEGPGAEGMNEDDDETLLDASEKEDDANYPATNATPSESLGSPSAIGLHGTISDPEPDVAGIAAVKADDEEEICDADEEEKDDAEEEEEEEKDDADEEASEDDY